MLREKYKDHWADGVEEPLKHASFFLLGFVLKSTCDKQPVCFGRLNHCPFFREMPACLGQGRTNFKNEELLNTVLWNHGGDASARTALGAVTRSPGTIWATAQRSIGYATRTR